MNLHRELLAPILLVAGTLTVAGMLWLGLAGRLAATGLSIEELVEQRQELLRHRAGARVRYAVATDPRLLAERARSLGFRAMSPVARIGVMAPMPDGAQSPNASSPLSLAARKLAPPSQDHDWPGLSLIGLDREGPR